MQPLFRERRNTIMHNFKYDAVSNKIVMTEQEAHELKIYVEGFSQGAIYCSTAGQTWRRYLAIQLAKNVEGTPKSMNALDTFELINNAAKAHGVIL